MPDLAWIVLALSLGALGWTFVEYCFHRWMMHGRFGPEVVVTGHADHHRMPQQPPLASPYAVLAAFVLSLTLIPLQGALLAILLGLPWYTGAAVGPGFLLGYLGYVRTHHNAHFRPPRTRYGQWLRRRHLHHHHVDASGNFCFTVPVWDALLRTNLRPLDEFDPETGRPVLEKVS